MANEHESRQGSDGRKPSVYAELTFLRRSPLWDHEKPYRMRYMPVEDVPKTNFLLDTFSVSLCDVRPYIPRLSLDHNGFEVHRLESRLEYNDFFDYDKVRSIYIKEVQDLVKQVCGAKHAHPLDYELRRRHESFPVSTGQAYAFGQPNLLTHIDITLSGLQEIVKEVYGDAADEILESRVQCVTSLRDIDIVPADAVYERVVAENAMIHHNQEQAWHYLADQEASEALIFRATDSSTSLASPAALSSISDVSAHASKGPDPFFRDSDLPAFVLLPVACGATITDSYIRDFRDRHLETDDIFQPNFLDRVIFYGAKETDVDIQPSAVSLLSSWQTKQWRFAELKAGAQDFAPGPYISHQETIWEPWRIYQDPNLAMTVSFLPQTAPDSRSSLRELDDTFTSNQIRMAVPSRCYSTARKVAGKPLLGARIVVKDIFDIKGSKTSLCNRAWLEYHSPKNATAPSVERLQALGAVIVGKTRLNAMIVREETMECVEFLAPFNPRGDGYQTSSGSSSGSCVALSAYPWVDFALGSDTNGSCRKPAYWMGCYAIRPTTDAIDTRGIASFCRFYDVPSFFGRDISRFEEFASLWYGDSPKLAKLLPSPTAATLPYYKDACGILKNFVEEYKVKFDKQPFFHRALRWRWEMAEKLTLKERDLGWERILTYKKWLLHNIFQEGTVVVLPIDEGRPNNRESPPPPFALLNGYHPLYMSPIAGTPEVTAPIGEISYHSEVTQRLEPLPISVSVVSPPGTDLDLINLVHGALKIGGKPTSVATGRSIFRE
ncbi:Scytalone dehydratase-like protein Arp1 [Paramyrothecium foliicola]|nr:Scytalone dehydratase-like protein Arp1 [Paramyrothecium foliicola]